MLLQFLRVHEALEVTIICVNNHLEAVGVPFKVVCSFLESCNDRDQLCIKDVPVPHGLDQIPG